MRRRKKFNMIDTFEDCIGDLFETENVQKMGDIKHHLNLTCLDHSLFVSYVSYRICRFFKWDHRSAARGGLLHDLFLYDWRDGRPKEGWHGTVHPAIALKNAESLCSSTEYLDELNDMEKDMIVKHMWPVTSKKPSYKESMLICLVDKLCAAAEMTLIFQMIHFKSKYFRMASQAA